MNTYTDDDINGFVGGEVAVTLRDGRTFRGPLGAFYDAQRSAYKWNVEELREVTATGGRREIAGQFYAEDVVDISLV